MMGAFHFLGWVSGRGESSAGSQPAVSPISTRQAVRSEAHLRFAGWKPCDTADWKSALRSWQTQQHDIRPSLVLTRLSGCYGFSKRAISPVAMWTTRLKRIIALLFLVVAPGLALAAEPKLKVGHPAPKL